MSYFWLLLVMFCVVWYFTMTFYVGVRGVFDIKEMLLALKSDETLSSKED
ncbi:MAG: hypothetical protein ACP5UA_11200 [Candidatus Hydrogenedens sp.]